MITTLETAQLPPIAPAGAVVSIGVFDGVHLGHQAILAANLERAQAIGADVIDEPHENPKARAIEFSLRDPDGYAISVAQSMR